jgi:hypothetical protein
MSSVSCASRSFSRLAWTFKFLKSSDLEINLINSNIRRLKQKLIFKKGIYLCAYKCVIIQFV